MPLIGLSELLSLSTRVLQRAGASDSMAQATAAALVDAEARGLSTHGVARLPLYCTHLRAGRANGSSRPAVVSDHGGCCLIDAGGGLAYEAMALAGREAIARAGVHGIAFAGVHRR